MFFFFKQKTAYEMRISDWSSDVCSSDLAVVIGASFIGMEASAALRARGLDVHVVAPESKPMERVLGPQLGEHLRRLHERNGVAFHLGTSVAAIDDRGVRSEEHTSELQSLMRISSAVFCLNKKIKNINKPL